ncbi:hypothetical protein JH06_1832 [Blastocystis sp. subtype 4]|uniref:hypothetical protein n=1 Tax=Blastocystis sp. subtype 4 TaxID=944170 RepID=UPI0007116EE4|nr:hypothetical protein JH06_1832 [Blastocystis sp. subtype 4]KNB44580.1 hypothetical protein JH06_1832 [Blastocystis sp. subtype 4]|eukprot:XP_014528021.1 hypothetical protein JH06_1832 [Blastocystis sp. subtype 4]
MTEGSGRWFVKIYAPWCGHCKRLAPIWEDIAETLDQEVNVAEVVFCGMVELKIDATMQEKLARRFNVDGFPTLLLMENGFFSEFKGKREEQALIEFARAGFSGLDGLRVIPRESFSMMDANEKIAEMISSYLFSHPLVACIVFIVIGVILGWILTTLLIEMFTDGREVTTMDELPNMKEK